MESSKSFQTCEAWSMEHTKTSVDGGQREEPGAPW